MSDNLTYKDEDGNICVKNIGYKICKIPENCTLDIKCSSCIISKILERLYSFEHENQE